MIEQRKKSRKIFYVLFTIILMMVVGAGLQFMCVLFNMPPALIIIGGYLGGGMGAALGIDLYGKGKKK